MAITIILIHLPVWLNFIQGLGIWMGFCCVSLTIKHSKADRSVHQAAAHQTRGVVEEKDGLEDYCYSLIF